METGQHSAATTHRPVLRVVPAAGGAWRVEVQGLPPSDYESLEEACAEAEAYLAGQGRGGEIVVDAGAAS